MAEQEATSSTGEEHHIFLTWATQEAGITINGVSPVRVPGSGLGVRASRAIKKGELLASVPAAALLTIQTSSVKQQSLPHDCTVHGLLAAYLTLQDGREDAPHRTWQAVWPKREEFDEIMPMRWEDQEKDLLTPYAREMLAKQESKIAKDWDAVHAHLPSNPSRELYTYYWLIVNTRTFYWDYPKPVSTKGRPRNKKQKLVPDDCMALCPFMEYFNHADEGCHVDHDAWGFTVTADRNYETGEEIFVSYGNHSNDFLLVEYGFVLERNKWDVCVIDHSLLARLSTSQQRSLEEKGFLGNYIVDVNQEVCYRTQVALRMLTLPEGQWCSFVDGLDDGEKDQENVDEYFVELLETTLKGVDEFEKRVKTLADGYRKSMLMRRWSQARAILSACVKGLRQY
ncbi:SET domain-containing protein [Saccharata proteae CBS 121410]|uniref:SET domain-containing protein n=1 Tax=Saccharata proteae CBS 121410 TaxID=1314787 RepID=A0A9P4HYQ8_9PEZI|nr:SET domain-containing protein [Saccharata proteae CBS 121410]